MLHRENLEPFLAATAFAATATTGSKPVVLQLTEQTGEHHVEHPYPPLGI
jgi:hypothetical protein